MIIKRLEKKVNVNGEEIIQDLTCPMQLEYYMTKSDIEGQEELRGVTAYGIEIVKILGDKETERQMVKNFCCNEVLAKETISMLADNTVTPSGLYFVLEDLIGV